MEIKHGYSRSVLIFKNYVIKFPRIYLKNAFNRAKEEKRRKRLWWHLNRWTYMHYLSIHRYLFKGIIDNWLEYVFFIKSRHVIIVPTYFSFFGLFNIQARAHEFDGKKFRQKCWGVLGEITDWEVFNASHEFSSVSNYGIYNRRLRLFDYGNKRAQVVIVKYSKELSEQFKFGLKDF